ncbi:hypothetical protein [Chryseobacterium sp.]|uniref:hypothetical protein n=1 Tax=Chryseobacterium sp. TaxID=1871047 RepID=UPI000B8206F3
MFQFLKTYRQIVIVLLTIVMAIPCSVKRDLKQQFRPESTQSTNSNSPKIGCTSFCSVYSESNKKQKSQTFRKAAFPYSSLYAHESIITADFIAPIIDNYHFYKEKIPTHIRNQQFLI